MITLKYNSLPQIIGTAREEKQKTKEGEFTTLCTHKMDT